MPRITYLKTEYSFVMWERLTSTTQNFVLLNIATSVEVKTMIEDGVEGYDIIETKTDWTVITPGVLSPLLPLEKPKLIRTKKKIVRKRKKRN